MKETRILCWNVNGIRAAEKKGFLEWLYRESPDILCLQETKAHLDQLGTELQEPHREIDLARPKENEKISGFLPEERAWIDKFIAHGYVDAFRHFNKEPNQYTWWDLKSGARERNVGWRLDYFLVSEDLMPSVSRAFIMPEVMGSDHCPVGITLKTD